MFPYGFSICHFQPSQCWVGLHIVVVMLFCSVLEIIDVVLYCIVLFCFALYRIESSCLVLYCSALYGDLFVHALPMKVVDMTQSPE